jgi:hypothetical protein
MFFLTIRMLYAICVNMNFVLHAITICWNLQSNYLYIIIFMLYLSNVIYLSNGMTLQFTCHIHLRVNVNFVIYAITMYILYELNFIWAVKSDTSNIGLQHMSEEDLPEKFFTCEPIRSFVKSSWNVIVYKSIIVLM